MTETRDNSSLVSSLQREQMTSQGILKVKKPVPVVRAGLQTNSSWVKPLKPVSSTVQSWKTQGRI